MKIGTIAFVIAVLAVASACAVQSGNAQRISYSQYGFDFSLPGGYVKVAVPQNAPDGWVEVYTSGAFAAGVGVGKMGAQNDPVSEADKLARKEELSRTSSRTPQGVAFAGAVGNVTLTKEMIKGMPPSLPLRAGMSIRMAMYMSRLPSDQARMLAFFFVGPPERASEMDSLTQFVLNSVNFTTLKPVQATANATSQILNGTLALAKGQIALYGKVESLKVESKSMTLLVDKVVAFRQPAVALDPPRQKIVRYSALPAGVVVGSRVIVVGKNAGTGKPMTADTIKLETPSAPGK